MMLCWTPACVMRVTRGMSVTICVRGPELVLTEHVTVDLMAAEGITVNSLVALVTMRIVLDMEHVT